MLTRRQGATVFVGVVISCVFLWIASRNTSLDEVVSSFRRVQAVEVFLLTAGMFVFYWIRTLRWQFLLAPIAKVTAKQIFGPVMIGYAANFVLPLQLGEVARSLAAREKTPLPLMPIAFSIIVERIFDFLVILAALALSLALHPVLPKFVTTIGLVVAAGVLLLVVATVLYTFKTDMVLGQVRRLVAFLPPRSQEVAVRQLRIGADGLLALRDGRALSLAAAASVAQWAVLVVCIDISLRAVDMQVPAATLLLIIALLVLGGTIPNAPGYIGSIQAGFVVALEITGADPAKGMTASIVFHSVYALTAITLGLVSLRSTRLSWRSVSSGENAHYE